MPSSLKTYVGALHIHTDRSDGEGTLDMVLEAARRTGVDFVILTDHGTRGYGDDNVEGWHGGVLVLCGEEVETPSGHFLAFETREAVGKPRDTEDALQRVRRQYGQVVSIHHQLSGPPILPPDQADLMEIWSFQDEFLSRVSAKYLAPAAAKPDKLIMGPTRRLLWQWDRQLEKRRLPVVGGLNVHQRKQPLLEWKMMFPYEVAFGTIATCIQIPELPTVSTRARDLVWNALREGRSFLMNRAVADGKDFAFEYHAPDGKRKMMGDEAAYAPGGRFYMRIPEEAEVVLRHNGQPLFWGTTMETSFPTASPGSYRMEVYLNRRLWILGNPIRLVDDDGIMQPTVSDVT